MIDGQTKIIDALTEELKGVNTINSHVITQHGKMRDRANERGDRILELQGKIAGYKNKRRVEWFMMFVVIFAAAFFAHIAWAAIQVAIGL